MALTNGFPFGNHLLEALSSDSFRRLQPSLEPVTMTLGRLLMQSGEPIKQVYFPVTGYASLLFNFSTGPSCEVGMIGQDGMIGSSLISGSHSTHLSAMVQCAGSAYRMTADNFRSALTIDKAFLASTMHYSGTLMTQIALTAACNCKHSIRQRLARWILMARDRSDTDSLPMTQEMLAVLLGSHRPSITGAAAFLKMAGVIEYAHGVVTITNRTRLEGYACECHLMKID